MVFGKQGDSPKYDKIDTIIGPNTEITGNVFASGTVRVEGSLEGDIVVKGNVVIGEQGSVQGNIKCVQATIANYLYGNVECTDILEVLSTGKLMGDAKVSRIYVDEGALFDGQCIMRKAKEGQIKENPQKKSDSIPPGTNQSKK